MKLNLLLTSSIAAVVVLGLVPAIRAGADPVPSYTSLFRSGEVGISAFGEAAQGNVDVQPNQTVTQTTTTTTVGVQPPSTTAPLPTPTPTPTQTPDNAGLHKALTKTTTTTKTVNGVTTKTIKKTTYAISNHHEHFGGGGGVAVQYFFTRYLGVQVEGDFLGGYEYCTAVTGNLILRWPFEFGERSETSGYSKDGKDGKTVVTGPTWGLAPYILGGGGGQWDGRGVGIGDVGGGVEFRFSRHYGIFAEGRWIIHDHQQSYAAETLGFTYTF